ncbi:hypothetical protein TgHK011_004246 [Trichoderma gracile]|nr:hypothetical protein TgHK011_004246 [Trichoderma gracile]
MTFSKPREWSGNYGRQCSRTEESADISNSLLGSLNSTEISIRRTDALLVRVEIPQLRPDGLTRLPLLTGHNCYYRCRCTARDCCMNRLKTLKGKLNVSTAVQYQSIADVNEWKSFTAETCIQQFTNSGDSSGIMQSAPNAHDCFAYSIVERRTTCEDALEPQLAQEVGNAPEGHQEK